MFDKAQLRGKSLPASMLLDCKYRYFLAKIQKQGRKEFYCPSICGKAANNSKA